MPGRLGIPGNNPFVSLLFAALFAALSAVVFSEAAMAARPTSGISADEQRGGKPSKLILRAQKALYELGVYRGPQDGRLDAATKAAVQAYQRGIGLKDNGRITKKLVESLENSIQVRVLLKRLDKIRVENMSAARKALLSHSATQPGVARGLAAAVATVVGYSRLMAEVGAGNRARSPTDGLEATSSCWRSWFGRH